MLAKILSNHISFVTMNFDRSSCVKGFFFDFQLLYYYNCPRYIALRDETASLPEIQDLLAPYKDLFQYLEQHTKTNITTSEDVFYLDNLFQTLVSILI